MTWAILHGTEGWVLRCSRPLWVQAWTFQSSREGLLSGPGKVQRCLLVAPRTMSVACLTMHAVASLTTRSVRL